MTSTKEAIELITRGTEEILVEEELKILSQGMSEEELHRTYILAILY